MIREDAERLRDRLSATHPDRDTHTFMLTDDAGEWTVAKVALPPGMTQSLIPTRRPPEDSPHPNHGGRLAGGIPNWSTG